MMGTASDDATWVTRVENHMATAAEAVDSSSHENWSTESAVEELVPYASSGNCLPVLNTAFGRIQTATVAAGMALRDHL